LLKIVSNDSIPLAIGAKPYDGVITGLVNEATICIAINFRLPFATPTYLLTHSMEQSPS